MLACCKCPYLPFCIHHNVVLEWGWRVPLKIGTTWKSRLFPISLLGAVLPTVNRLSLIYSSLLRIFFFQLLHYRIKGSAMGKITVVFFRPGSLQYSFPNYIIQPTRKMFSTCLNRDYSMPSSQCMWHLLSYVLPWNYAEQGNLEQC